MEETSRTTSFLPVSFPHPVSSKLDNHNFLVWRKQILTTLRGHKLQHFLSETSVLPSEFLSSDDETQNHVNPKFQDWEQQDQLIMSWLLASITDALLTRMVNCDTSAQVWKTLELYFATQVRAKVTQFKTQLHNTKKGDLSISDYLLKIRNVVDLLALVGHKISVKDHIDAIFEGLPQDYETFIISVNSRLDPYTVEEIEALLLAQESRIEKNIKIADLSTPSLAHLITTNRNGSPHFNYRASTRNSNFRPPTHSGNGMQHFRGNFTQQGRGRHGRGSWKGNNKPQCQLCGRIGHVVMQCYYRFDQSFTGPSQLQGNRPQGNMAHLHQQLSENFFPGTSSVKPTTAKIIQDNNWYPDSGATHHLTPNLNNLLTKSQFPSSDEVFVGNGKGLPIHHIGHTSFSSSFIPSKTLALKQLLHDLSTRTILMHGQLKGGLYVFDNTQLKLPLHNSSCFASTALPSKEPTVPASPTSPFTLWHNRLGHPSSHIVSLVLNKCNLPHLNKIPSLICSACCMGKIHKSPFLHSTSSYTKPLELIHTDLWGPASTPSSHGHQYYIHFIDAYSRFTWIYMLKHKSEAFQVFLHFKSQVELQLGHKIKAVQSDWGGEYRSFTQYITSNGIIHRISCPYTHEQNGLAELLKNKSPLEVLFHQKPSYSQLKVFGCMCYPNLRPFNHHKLQFRSIPCTFLGYSLNHKGYKCLSPNGNILISRDVIFDEHAFPFAQLQSQKQTTSPFSSSSTSLPCQTSLLLMVLPSSTSCSTSSPTNPSIFPATSNHNVASQPPPSSAPPFPSHHMITRSKNGIFKPKAYLSSTTPTSVPEALQLSHWKQAMTDEYLALLRNNTWDLVPLPTDRKLIGCKWVFKVKENPDGTINKYKACLVAKGFHQIVGFDFNETFSPVVKPTTIRIVLTIALNLQWKVRQLDVNNAFLNGDLHEDIFMHQPQGFIDPINPNYVCKLNKSLYGLKQAPRAWFEKLHQALGILVYVDDILITGNNDQFVQHVITQLNNQFTLKDLGDIDYFLGIQVKHTSAGMHLSQAKYISNLLQKTKMLHVKPVPTPMVSNQSLSNSGSAPFSNTQLYRSIVGALQYATITRPDITYSVNRVCQFMQAPLTAHWKAVKRILRYLAGTLHHGLHLQHSSNSHLNITGFCDADWASDVDDRHSTSGYCLFLGPNLVSWHSRKQHTVSKSSTEAEYRSVATLVAEISWLQSLLRELNISSSTTPVIWCDNLSTVYLSANPILHARTKHIKIDLYFVREKVLQKQIQIHHVPSSDQLADVFTKATPNSRFLTIRAKLSVNQSPP
ncbi:Retrovirus-related Pol polyprotein from transposon TNT 1-94 [Vitis vinifera]|uniref:Retrovirus-related Pol polyprotein from transposon TNT 1-94 n=2 Tax=Vitis vinifera TaxID=29760 RepID=A0A438IKE7_VITVI|nr:Retrovirus-related Pol polyprotein from transposon TNT 1-94 [Vitis vinifera]